MQRRDLEHVILAACKIAQQDQVLVIGSQSILGTYSEFELPEESTHSTEADVFPLFDDDGSRSTLIDGTIGELSPFHQQFGYYAQGVDRRTATLPTGWPSRLVPVRNENTEYRTGWCLDVHDLCVAKLVANRDKDRSFLKALIENDLVSVATIIDRLESTELDEARKDVARTWIGMWEVDQPRYRPPELPFVPVSLTEHPATVLDPTGWEQRTGGYELPTDGSWPRAQGGQEPGSTSFGMHPGL
ncbi:hypothetical protein D3248_01750 [Leucobacter zeae]|nr:hypothetical protein [Leucobacter zeae]